MFNKENLETFIHKDDSYEVTQTAISFKNIDEINQLRRFLMENGYKVQGALSNGLYREAMRLYHYDTKDRTIISSNSANINYYLNDGLEVVSFEDFMKQITEQGEY